MANSIKEKTVSGLTWSALDNIASQGITFIIGIVLARILTPSEFGTLGIAMIFVSLFNQIVDCGFSNALIRRSKVSDIDYNTAFIYNCIISIVLYVLSFVSSSFISDFFHDKELSFVLKWLSLLIIINALGLVQKTKLIKIIDFKTQTKISITSSVLSGIIGISAAIYGFGIMSLVYQQLFKQGINTILLWKYNSWKPKLEFSIISFKSQFSYGIKLLFAGLIDFIFNEAASFVIGKVYTPATLGQYTRAKQFSSIFSSNLSMVMQRVTFPVLSNFQDDKTILVEKYKIIVKCLMLISGFFMISLACMAKPIIYILIGEKWAPAVVFLQIICFNDMFYPVKQVNLNIIQVVGRSDLVLKVTILKRIFQAFPIALGFYNIYYMLIGLVVASIIGLIINAYYASICIPYNLKQQMIDLSEPFVVCLISGFSMFIITLLDLNLYVQLFLQLIIGCIVFFIIVKIKDLEEYYYIEGIVKTMVLKPFNRK